MALVRKVAAERGLPPLAFPQPEPFRVDVLDELDLTGFGAALFSAGFRPDYESWVRLPGAFDELGFPRSSSE